MNFRHRLLATAVTAAAILAVAAPTKAKADLYPLAYAETGTGVSSAQFAGEVRAILDDPRSWHEDYAGKRVVLATAETLKKYCGYTDLSCALGSKIAFIHIDRWRAATPEYMQQASLTAYRAYVINHEVGHMLGYVHVECPGPGSLAPVMQPQTMGLNGCTPNSWPWPSGRQ